MGRAALDRLSTSSGEPNETCLEIIDSLIDLARNVSLAAAAQLDSFMSSGESAEVNTSVIGSAVANLSDEQLAQMDSWLSGSSAKSNFN